MEMVIGGAFQGKAAFAEKMYPGISCETKSPEKNFFPPGALWAFMNL